MSDRARLSYRWVYAALAAYVLGFALFAPRVLMIVDEDRYVSQAVAFANGSTTIPGAEIVVPPVPVRMISNYPPGTSLLQTPFVWAFGWRGAMLLSLVSLIVATLVTGLWLQEGGRSPTFALLIPGFFGAAFFGRIGMSDVPSAALVALTCLLLWRATPQQPVTSLLAGFCITASLLFREPLLMLLAPLAVGAMARRAVSLPLFVLGGVLGVAARLALSQLLFGSAFYVRDPGIEFSFSSIQHVFLVYAAILLVMFPGGALLPFFYRGPRRAELVASVVLYVGLFLLYGYDSVRDNGLAKGVILASRFMVPTLPILAWMSADVWPRLAIRGFIVPRVMAGGVIALAFLVHPLARRQETVPLALVRSIQSHTNPEALVMTNSNATLKYLSPSYGPRRLILRYGMNADSVAQFASRYGNMSMALLDRSDSEMFRAESVENAMFVATVRSRCALRPQFDSTFDSWARLHVYDVSSCR